MKYSLSWDVVDCPSNYLETSPVGTFEPNGFGLYDMHGNVFEWVEDCGNTTYRWAPKDGSAWTEGDCSLRVLRGGSWYDSPRLLRSADRFWNYPSVRDDVRGFRVTRTLSPPAP